MWKISSKSQKRKGIKLKQFFPLLSLRSVCVISFLFICSLILGITTKRTRDDAIRMLVSGTLILIRDQQRPEWKLSLSLSIWNFFAHTVYCAHSHRNFRFSAIRRSDDYNPSLKRHSLFIRKFVDLERAIVSHTLFHDANIWFANCEKEKTNWKLNDPRKLG